jgi:hypothetical protein
LRDWAGERARRGSRAGRHREPSASACLTRWRLDFPPKLTGRDDALAGEEQGWLRMEELLSILR